MKIEALKLTKAKKITLLIQVKLDLKNGEDYMCHSLFRTLYPNKLWDDYNDVSETRAKVIWDSIPELWGKRPKSKIVRMDDPWDMNSAQKIKIVDSIIKEMR